MFDTILEQFSKTPGVEWLAMATGIIGVWLGIKEKIVAWPLFITCYSSYIYISYQYGLYSFMGMNVVFIGISIYGWIKWSIPVSEKAPKLPISRTARGHWLIVFGLLCLGTFGIGLLLQLTTSEAKLPYLDAFATCCGFAAQWMLGRKHIETWLFWILSDVVYLGLFAAKASWPSVILFVTFILLAIKGWHDWRPQLQQPQQQSLER